MKKSLYIGLVCSLMFVSSSLAAIYTWDAPTNNVDGTPLTDLGGYRYYSGTNGTKVYTYTQDVGNSVFATNTVYTRGVVYSAVTAYNIEGNESEFSEELVNCSDIPNAPVISTLAYNFKTGLMKVTWTKPTKNVDGTLITSPVSYIISYGKSYGVYTMNTNVPVTATTVSITIPKNSGIWYFAMKTSNSWGNVSSYSSEWTAGSSVPNAPKNISVIN